MDNPLGFHWTVSYVGSRVRSIRGVGPNLENWVIGGPLVGLGRLSRFGPSCYGFGP